ncbi:MAG: lactate/malate dehydrogenase family protein [Planctomycetota bacterium]
MRISVVGMGQVGAATAHALVTQGLASDLVLTSRNEQKAEGEAMDLNHAGAILPYVTHVAGGGVDLTAGSDLVILAHSVPTERPGRKLLAAGNGRLFRETMPRLAELSPDAVYLVLSNPVDALTWLTIKVTGLPPQRVIGAGTIIDSARVRTKLAARYGIHPDDLRVYVLGEHGEEQFVAVSLARGGGVRFSEPSEVTRLFEEARSAGWEVFQRKGYTNYAVAQSAVLIARTVLYNERRTLPVSTLISGYLGEHDVCASLPCVVGKRGVDRLLEPNLPDDEVAAFRKSLASIRESIAVMKAEDGA